MKLLSVFVFISILFAMSPVYARKNNNTLITPFERSAGKQTATYDEVVQYYTMLNRRSRKIYMEQIGKTDGGYPLYTIYYSNDRHFDAAKWRREGKVIIMINNGIHPGEPDGVDASMMLLRDAATGKIEIPDNVALAVIPLYNVGGALNRNSYSRTNQNGPESYGFRGNARNLDLNRDFIKTDAAETRAFERLFTYLDPDILIDNHVSDGADYQHIMTLLATQHNKLGGNAGEYMYHTLDKMIYNSMKTRGYDLVPYVNDFDNTPDKGWREFYDPPRFSSGYAALFGTFAYVPETHMLKPFEDRVKVTYALMLSFIAIAGTNAADIIGTRKADRESLLEKTQFPLEWKVDTTRFSSITFKGFEAEYHPSKISGKDRLYYNHDKPYTRDVPFYNHFEPAGSVKAPKAYILPRAWSAVARRLKINGVEMQRIQSDTIIKVNAYHITNYETVQKPYENHYLHKNVQVSPVNLEIKCVKGDYYIPLNQRAKRYLVETLEPMGPDGFLAWNYFDGILQQKEYFSDYVFEDLAAELLEKNPGIRQQLEEKKNTDSKFAADGAAQLDFVYRHSPYFEESFMRYPVYRVE